MNQCEECNAEAELDATKASKIMWLPVALYVSREKLWENLIGCGEAMGGIQIMHPCAILRQNGWLFGGDSMLDTCPEHSPRLPRRGSDDILLEGWIDDENEELAAQTIAIRMGWA